MPVDAAGELRVVLVTAPDRETAERLGADLVEERLAACANLVPGVTSIYRWEGAVERDEEVLMVLKTRTERVGTLVRRVEELHPYDVPEVLALPVDAGHAPYARWVRDATGKRDDDAGA